MRKEDLLYLKKQTERKALQCTGMCVKEEELKMFSVKQIEALCKIMKRNQKEEHEHSSFLALSTTMALCKANGKIVDFNYPGTGEVKEISEEEATHSAGEPILKAYKKEKKTV